MKTTKTKLRPTATLLVMSTLVWFVFTTPAQHPSTADGIEPSVAMFLKITGVNGEVTEPAYEGWIAVDSFNYGVTRPGRVPDGRRPDPANHRGLTISKGADKATPFFYLHASSGEPIEEVVLAVVRTTADSHSIQEYRLSNALVTSVQTGGTRNASARGAEKVTFSYQSIEWAYVRSDPVTGRLASEVAIQWDRSQSELD
jgi:type VI secretion system Hcp family effector